METTLRKGTGAELTDVAERPYAFIKHQMAQSKSYSFFVSQLLEQGD